MANNTALVVGQHRLKLRFSMIILVSCLTACASQPTPSATAPLMEQPTEISPAEASTPTLQTNTLMPSETFAPTPFPTPPNLLGDGWLPENAVLRIGTHPGVVQRDPITTEVLWAVQTGRPVYKRTTSPDSKWIAASVRRKSIYVWDAATGALQVSSEHADEWLQTYSWSPDSRYLVASFSGDENPNRLIVMDVPAREIAYQVEEPGRTQYIVWTSDSRLLIAGGYGSNDISIYDAASGKVIHHLVYETDNQSVTSLVMSADETKLVVVYGDPEYLGPHEAAVIWDIQTGMLIREFKHSALWDVALSPDGTRLALSDSTGFMDYALGKTVPIWNIETGEITLELTLPYDVEDQDDINYGTWSTDGTMFAAVLGSYIGVWDTATGRLIQVFNVPRCSYCAPVWSEDDTRLRYRDHLLVVATGQSTQVSATPTPVGTPFSSLSPVTDVIWSKDEACLITGSGFIGYDGVNVWDAQTGTHLREIDGTNSETGWRYFGIASLALNPDGKQLAVAALAFDHPQAVHVGGSLTLWDIDTGELIRAVAEFEERINEVAWSPDGRLLAVASEIGLVLWDTTTWEEVYRDDVPTCCAAWQPDGDYLAIGREGRVIILDPTGRVIKEENFNPDHAYNRDITALAWNPSKPELAVGIEGGTITVWDVDFNERSLTFDQQAWPISSIAWSPDGQQLAASTGNGSPPAPYCVSGGCFEPGLFGNHTLVVWDVATSKPLQVLYGHAAEIEAVRWSPDGTLLASASLDGSVLVWTIDE